MSKKETLKNAEKKQGSSNEKPSEKQISKIKTESEEISEADKKQEEEIEKMIESSRKAGEIAKITKDFIRQKIKTGAKAIEIIQEIEKKILELEGKPAFPINVCINNIAAHYTSPVKDDTIIADGDIVKIDFGVQIDGYCVDNAFTISFNEDESLKNLIDAPEVAVKAAIMMIKPGVKTNEVAKKIEEIVKGYGYRPIKELGGHKIEQWTLHGTKELPNIGSKHGEEIEENEIYAVEVFASTGEGTVHSSRNAYIFSMNSSAGRVPLRSKVSKKILGVISREFKTLPFCERLITNELSGIAGISFGMRELLNTGKISKYPVLLEKKGVYIGQFEETILVTKDGCEKLT